jgi:hypothetical protein
VSAVAYQCGGGIDRIMAGLPLDAELAEALTEGAGPLGVVLMTARAYTAPEAPAWPATGLEPRSIVAAYLSALRWTNTVLGELGAEITEKPDENLQALATRRG